MVVEAHIEASECAMRKTELGDTRRQKSAPCSLEAHLAPAALACEDDIVLRIGNRNPMGRAGRPRFRGLRKEDTVPENSLIFTSRLLRNGSQITK